MGVWTETLCGGEGYQFPASETNAQKYGYIVSQEIVFESPNDSYHTYVIFEGQIRTPFLKVTYRKPEYEDVLARNPHCSRKDYPDTICLEHLPLEAAYAAGAVPYIQGTVSLGSESRNGILKITRTGIGSQPNFQEWHDELGRVCSWEECIAAVEKKAAKRLSTDIIIRRKEMSVESIIGYSKAKRRFNTMKEVDEQVKVHQDAELRGIFREYDGSFLLREWEQKSRIKIFDFK